MHGPVCRLIREQGREYTIRNATRGSGGRDTPAYSDDGTVFGVLERRSRQPGQSVDSDGADAEMTLELRIVGAATIREPGDPDGYPTQLDPPDGPTYEVVAEHREDSGVRVLTVERA